MLRRTKAPEKRTLRPRHLVGWKEYIDFPEWGVEHVKAKIDTGARTSAVHVVRYNIQETNDGRTVELHMSLNRRRPEDVTVVRTPLIRMVVVANPGGYREARPLVATNIRVGRLTKRVFLTVTNRANMLFRVLLGRKALEGDFVVDVSRKYRTKDEQTENSPVAARPKVNKKPKIRVRDRNSERNLKSKKRRSGS